MKIACCVGLLASLCSCASLEMTRPDSSYIEDVTDVDLDGSEDMDLIDLQREIDYRFKPFAVEDIEGTWVRPGLLSITRTGRSRETIVVSPSRRSHVVSYSFNDRHRMRTEGAKRSRDFVWKEVTTKYRDLPYEIKNGVFRFTLPDTKEVFILKLTQTEQGTALELLPVAGPVLFPPYFYKRSDNKSDTVDGK